jgi:DNA processing protein
MRRLALGPFSFSDIIAMDNQDDFFEYLGKSGARLDRRNWTHFLVEKQRLLDSADSYQAKFHKMGVSIIFRDDPQFPKQLFDLKDPPLWLFVQGDPSVLSQSSMTVVGTRKPTVDGIWLTQYIGHCLGAIGHATISGLALGIDQEIHVASLRANVPTIAVLGTGIMSNYPNNSERLRHQIVQNGGAIITEYLPDESYSAQNFVKRNRIQAALGQVLIPVEWAVRSGTAHTVRHAFELDRPIGFLRTPNQSDFGWIPKVYKTEENCFTCPLDQDEFLGFVDKSMDEYRIKLQDQFSFLDRI